ncbi:MAG: NAD(P)/FAD-dependent oxidoreductase [Coriobacteriia bacterium]
MHVGVIGAGISGLTAAYRLASAGHEVTVFERESSPGGLAASATVGGAQIDRYFHFVCPPDHAYIDLIEELGLSAHLHWRNTRMGVYRDNAYHRFGTPASLLAFSPLPLSDRVRFAVSTLRARARHDWRDLDTITAREWLVAEQGARCYEAIWRPLLELKFGDAAGEISAAWMWARINRVAHSRSGIAMQEWLGYLEGGTATVVDVLVGAILARGGHVCLSTPIGRIETVDGHVAGLVANGSVVPCDAVIATVAPPVLAALAPDLPHDYTELLRSVGYLGVACRVLVAEEPLCDDFWLNIDDPDIPYAGVITYTNLDPLPGLGGAHLHYLPHYTAAEEPLADAGPSDDLPGLLRSLDRIRPGFSSRVVESHVFCDRFAQPLYTAGYAGRYGSLMEPATPIAGLFRADMSQVYPNDRSLVNAVTHVGYATAAAIAYHDQGSSL